MNKYTSKAVGFTLLEVLIAMSLSAALLVLLFTGVNNLQQTWLNIQQDQSTQEELMVASQFIRGRLEQILFLPPQEDQNATNQTNAQVIFTGESQTLTFVAPLMTYSTFAGIYKQTLSLNDNQLVFSWQPLRHQGQGHTGERVLMREITAFKIDYFGVADIAQNADNRHPEWHDSWDTKNGLPQLIRLRFTHHDEAAPELVIPLLW